MSFIGRKQFSWQKITKAIAWLLLLSLFANIFNVLTLTKPAQAVDASDYMFLFWPSDATCTTPAVPTGWTAVSDNVGEAFYQSFPRGAANYAAPTGSNTHTHTVTITTPSMSSSTIRKSGTGLTGSSATHAMTVNSANVDNQNNVPVFGDLCVIRFNNGIPNGDSAIPDGAVAIFDAAPPAGWSDYSSTFRSGSDRFIRGGTNATGGNNTHGGVGHAVTNIQLTTPDTTTTGVGGSNKSYAPTTHTHTVANQTSDFPDTQPPYRNIYLGQKSGTGNIPNGMLAMFQDIDVSVGHSVAGWTRVSDATQAFNNEFLKVTGTYGGTGGNATHTHTINTTSAAYTAPGSTATTGTLGPISDHVHNVTIALSGADKNLPVHTDVVIAKKQTAFTSLTTTGPYNSLGLEVQIDLVANNYHATDSLNNKYLDYVIFEDTAVPADGKPTAGETYMYKTATDCDTSGQFGAVGPGYTFQNTTFSAASGGGNSPDQKKCPNNNAFPDKATYTVWVRWWDGTSYGFNIYYEKSVTFYSVPTLTEILFMALVGCAVFLGVRTGVIKMRRTPKDKAEPPEPPTPKNNDSHSHQNQHLSRGSTDGINLMNDQRNHDK